MSTADLAQIDVLYHHRQLRTTPDDICPRFTLPFFMAASSPMTHHLSRDFLLITCVKQASFVKEFAREEGLFNAEFVFRQGEQGGS
jgi:hypothetical protein